jgi:hypothetical protein
MDFLQAINVGLEKSKKSLEARKQVDEVFNKVNDDLKHFTEGELTLERSVSLLAKAVMVHGALTGVESADFEHDKLVLRLKSSAGNFTEDVAGWKQRTAGFPCVLKFDGQELSCGNPAYLSEGLVELFGSIRFGDALMRLMKKAEEASMRQASAPKALAEDSTQSTTLDQSLDDGDSDASDKGLEDDNDKPAP